MFKRIMLALAFAAVFSLAGIGFTNKAEAWRGYWGRPYRAYYGGYYAPRTVYYGPVAPYRAFYGPRIYRPYYYGYYPYAVYPDYYYYGPPSGISVSFGF